MASSATAPSATPPATAARRPCSYPSRRTRPSRRSLSASATCWRSPPAAKSTPGAGIRPGSSETGAPPIRRPELIQLPTTASVQQIASGFFDSFRPHLRRHRLGRGGTTHGALGTDSTASESTTPVAVDLPPARSSTRYRRGIRQPSLSPRTAPCTPGGTTARGNSAMAPPSPRAPSPSRCPSPPGTRSRRSPAERSTPPSRRQAGCSPGVRTSTASSGPDIHGDDQQRARAR